MYHPWLKVYVAVELPDGWREAIGYWPFEVVIDPQTVVGMGVAIDTAVARWLVARSAGHEGEFAVLRGWSLVRMNHGDHNCAVVRFLSVSPESVSQLMDVVHLDDESLPVKEEEGNGQAKE